MHSSTTIDRLTAALAGRYTIERELGAGGMAMVYLAQDVKHDRQVALKVLRAELALALGPERFLREIKIAARLDHPHILALHDSGDGAAIAVVLFAVLRGTNLYGDLRPWTWGSTTTATLMHFFAVEKYPPSLLFLLATLPFALVLLAWSDGRPFTSRFAQALIIYGRVPLFFYILQWIWAKFVAGVTVFLIYGIKFGADGTPVEFGGPIWLTHVLWLAGAFALFPLCRRYAALKARRRDLAILRYL